MSALKDASFIIAKRLQLKRPLVILDTETTGLDVENDRIIEIYMHKIFPNGSYEVAYEIMNPGIPIPKESTDVHGITDDLVKEYPTFDTKADVILAFLEDSDVCAYNVNYDRSLLNRELVRAGKEPLAHSCKNVDPAVIFRRQEKRSLPAAYLFYTGTKLENAHAAEIDVNATVEVLALQLDKYSDLPKSVEDMSVYCNYGKDVLDPKGFFIRANDGKIYFNFGKNKGLQALDDKKYLIWMLTENYPLETKVVVHGLLDGSLK